MAGEGDCGGGVVAAAVVGVGGGVMKTVYGPILPMLGGGVDGSALIGIAKEVVEEGSAEDFKAEWKEESKVEKGS